MNLKNIKIFFKNNLIVVLVIIFTIPGFYTLLRPGFFPMQDDIQAFRIHQMDKCIQDFQIPCRWVPDAGYGYGYPLFEYYPPSVYYLGEAIHLLGFQFIDAVKILFILGFILSAFFMYLFLRTIFGEYPGLFGSILYTYVPYKAVDVYVRGALNEFFTFVFFPLIFWFSYLLIKTNKLKYLPWLAISIGLLLITHNLMSAIFMPVFGVWVLSWVLVEKRFSSIFKLILAGLLGIGLASSFSIPVLFEKQYAHLETLLGGYFDYRQHFVDLYQLFVSNHFGYGSSYIGPGDDLALTTGIIHFVLGLFVIVLALKNLKRNKKLSIVIFSLGAVLLASLFLTHQKSSFIWDKIIFLSWLQFPWRFLADSVFLLSIFGAGVIYYLIQEKLNKKIILGFMILVTGLLFILHLNFFQPREWLDITDQDKFSDKSWDKQQTISIFDYLPIYSKYPPVKKAPELPEVLSGEVIFLNYQKGSNYQYGKVDAKLDSKIRLPLFDFPGMKVLIDGKNVDFTHDDCSYEEFCLGLITYNIPKGEHTIKVLLTNTPIREVANALTLISMIFVGYLFLRGYKYEQNHS